MNTRSAGRELAFLAISQLSKSASLEPENLILAATRTLRDVAKQQLKQVEKDLRELGNFFFNEALSAGEKKEQIDINKIHDHVGKLELATFSLREALDLPELLNQPKEALDYAVYLINLYRINKASVNEIISEVLNTKKAEGKGWTIERTLTIDRDILRIAAAELLFEKDCPPVVVIDEALELSKKYGSEDSPKFVNGVLADVMEKLKG